jgi:hypothetical protein
VIDVPAATEVPVAVAMRGAGKHVVVELAARGWIVDNAEMLDPPGRYRRYIRRSAGEFSVTKEQYVAPRSGWVSDRTVCYLAAGRPAVVERTGIDGIPLGQGLLDFSLPEEALAGLEEVARNYERHSEAARELAEQHFAADRVLARVLDRLGGQRG